MRCSSWLLGGRLFGCNGIEEWVQGCVDVVTNVL